METLGDEVAFPSFDADGICQNHTLGLTKREYFAAMALQGLALVYAQGTIQMSAKEAADMAVFLADALINRLNKEE